MACPKAPGKQRYSYLAAHPKGLAVTSWSQGQRPDLSGHSSFFTARPQLAVWELGIQRCPSGGWVLDTQGRMWLFPPGTVPMTVTASSRARGRTQDGFSHELWGNPGKCQTLGFLTFALEFRASSALNSKVTSEGAVGSEDLTACC